MAKLSSSNPQLVQTLSDSLSSATSYTEITSAIICFTSFLNAGQIHHGDLAVLYPLLLPHLGNEQTVIQAAAAVEDLIEKSSSYTVGASTATRFVGRPRTDELIRQFICTDFVRQTVTEAVTNGEVEDESLAIMKLVCTIAEHSISFILKESPPLSPTPFLTLTSTQVQEMFSIVLAISCFPGMAHESFAVCELGSGVWLSLQEETAELGLVGGDGPGREGRGGKENEWAVLKGIFGALADGVRRRATWPSQGVDGIPKGLTLTPF
jgi:hypothetical protein